MAKDKPHEPALGGSYVAGADGARRRVAFTDEHPEMNGPRDDKGRPIDGQGLPVEAPKPDKVKAGPAVEPLKTPPNSAAKKEG